MKKSFQFLPIVFCLFFLAEWAMHDFFPVLPEAVGGEADQSVLKSREASSQKKIKADQSVLKSREASSQEKIGAERWIPDDTVLLFEWQPPIQKKSAGKKTAAETKLTIPPQLNTFFPFLSTMNGLEQDFRQNQLQLNLKRIIWGTYGKNRKKQDFIILSGNFKQAHGDYISKYIFPGRFTIRKESFDNKAFWRVTDAKKELLNTTETVIVYFAEPGMTVICPESFFEQYRKNVAAKKTKEQKSENFYTGISALPRDAAVKVYLNAQNKVLANYKDFQGIYASMQHFETASSPLKITVLLAVQDQKTAQQCAAGIKGFIDTVYQNAARNGGIIPPELSKAFTVKPDSGNRVRIEIQMDQKNGQIFLQQFFQTLHQSL